MTEASAGAWWSSPRAVKTARICMWVGFPLAGLIWTATRYRTNWYYYDEWSMIDRSMGGWHGLLEGHQGHLAIENYLVYRAQRAWFGLQGHQLVYAGFLASVAALQVSVALVLRRLGLPTLLALLSGTLIVFFGPGSQNTLWEFQQNINFSLALCFLAAFVAVGKVRNPRTALIVAGLLVLAVASDSGLAVLGAVFVGVIVVIVWPWRLAALALVPPGIANLLWLAFGDPGPTVGAPFRTMWIFASRLFTLSAASLVGGAERPSRIGVGPTASAYPLSGTQLGTIVVVLAVGCVAFGMYRKRLSREVMANLLGGVAAAVLAVAVLAKSRAFLITPAMFPGSRYLQWVAIFLLVGFAPAIVATVRPATARAQRIATAGAAVALAAIFVVNLGSFEPNEQFFKGWSQGVEASVRETVSLVDHGCGPGRRLDPGAQPNPTLAPQIEVRLIEALLQDGALTPEFGVPATPAVRKIVCVTHES